MNRGVVIALATTAQDGVRGGAVECKRLVGLRDDNGDEACTEGHNELNCLLPKPGLALGEGHLPACGVFDLLDHRLSPEHDLRPEIQMEEINLVRLTGDIY